MCAVLQDQICKQPVLPILDTAWIIIEKKRTILLKAYFDALTC